MAPMDVVQHLNDHCWICIFGQAGKVHVRLYIQMSLSQMVHVGFHRRQSNSHDSNANNRYCHDFVLQRSDLPSIYILFGIHRINTIFEYEK